MAAGLEFVHLNGALLVGIDEPVNLSQQVSARPLELSIRAQLLEEGGPPLWEAFMAELRGLHLGAPAKGPSVLAGLQAAYEEVVARKKPRKR